jgi:hypothetical protein
MPIPDPTHKPNWKKVTQLQPGDLIGLRKHANVLLDERALLINQQERHVVVLRVEDIWTAVIVAVRDLDGREEQYRYKPTVELPYYGRSTTSPERGDAAPVQRKHLDPATRLRLSRLLIDENRTRFSAQFTLNGRPVHQTTWRMWEEGVCEIDRAVLEQFCERTGFTVEWILNGDFESLPERLRSEMVRAYGNGVKAGSR